MNLPHQHLQVIDLILHDVKEEAVVTVEMEDIKVDDSTTTLTTNNQVDLVNSKLHLLLMQDTTTLKIVYYGHSYRPRTKDCQYLIRLLYL